MTKRGPKGLTRALLLTLSGYWDSKRVGSNGYRGLSTRMVRESPNSACAAGLTPLRPPKLRCIKHDAG